MVCLNFIRARFSSTVVSAPVVSRSSSRISAMISPLFFIRSFCSDSVYNVDRAYMFLERLRIFAKVSIIASVVCTACSLFRMVASMYSPRSVKTFGVYLLPPQLEVENFDFKFSDSSSVISSRYPSGNLSGLFLTASLMRLVFTPYISATSESSNTCSFRMMTILSSVFFQFYDIHLISFSISHHLLIFPFWTTQRQNQLRIIIRIPSWMLAFHAKALRRKVLFKLIQSRALLSQVKTKRR